MRRYCLILLLGLLPFFSWTQTVSPIDFMRMNPFQAQSNAATPLPYNGYFSIGLGNTNMNLSNGNFRYDNFFDFDADGRPKTINLNKLAGSLSEMNQMRMSVNEDVFGLGIATDKGMLTFNYRLRADAYLTLGDDLFQLAAYGNSAFMGTEHPAQITCDFNAMAFQEFSVGYQRNVSEKLSVGGRAKLLFGLLSVETNHCDIELMTDADTYGLRIKENLDMRLSTPVALTETEDGFQYQRPVLVGDCFKNVGFGVDLAAQYRFNKRFELVAALNDFGVVFWKNHTKNLYGTIAPAGQYYEDGSFFFNGLQIDELQKLINDKEYRKQYLNTLKSYFPYEMSDAEGYSRMLNVNPMVRGSFYLTPENRFSAQFQGVAVDGEFYPAFTVAYDGSFRSMFDVCVSYTMMRNSFDNLGLGLACNLGVFHIYATTNNLIGWFNPGNTSNMNAQIGIVFNFRK